MPAIIFQTINVKFISVDLKYIPRSWQNHKVSLGSPKFSGLWKHSLHRQQNTHVRSHDISWLGTHISKPLLSARHWSMKKMSLAQEQEIAFFGNKLTTSLVALFLSLLACLKSEPNHHTLWAPSNPLTRASGWGQVTSHAQQWHSQASGPGIQAFERCKDY